MANVQATAQFHLLILRVVFKEIEMKAQRGLKVKNNHIHILISLISSLFGHKAACGEVSELVPLDDRTSKELYSGNIP